MRLRKPLEMELMCCDLVLAVGLKTELSLHRMHHAAAHGNGVAQRLDLQSDLAQGMKSACRDGQVDGTAGGDDLLAHVGEAFE